MCASTLLSFHQLYIICQSNNSRFLQSLEGEAYEHHVVKNHAVGDTSELLELQSSFSREIENEILNMHGSKEINEAESEIAANAAVKELERIGSAENISLVEDVDVMHSLEEPLSHNKSDQFKNSTERPAIEEDSDDEQNTRNKSKVSKKQKNEEKVSPKTRTVKTQRKGVKSPKAEILKENITRSKSKTERTSKQLTDGKDVKENSFVDDTTQK